MRPPFTKNVLFSIVIPTYKRHKYLSGCLDCLAHYFDPAIQCPLGFEVEVLVCDDDQDNDVMVLLDNFYPWSTYIKGPSRGPAANRNYGASHACGEWIVFTDDDCLPQNGWLEAYAEYCHEFDVMEGKTSPSGRRMRADDECPINHAGGCLWSCNFAIRRTVFNKLNGFNEDFTYPACEDVELHARILKSSFRSSFVPSAEIYHPWRTRKGFSYVVIHAKSVAKFVKIHPENLLRFSALAQVLTLLRLCKLSFLQAVSSNNYNGLFRQIFLDLCSTFLIWYNVRKLIASPDNP